MVLRAFYGVSGVEPGSTTRKLKRLKRVKGLEWSREMRELEMEDNRVVESKMDEAHVEI